MKLLVNLVFFGIAMLYFRAALRVLDRRVTVVRASHGLGMAWGTAILGFFVIVVGFLLILGVKTLLTG